MPLHSKKSLKTVLAVLFLLVESILLIYIGYLSNVIAENRQTEPGGAASVQIMDSFDALIARTAKETEDAIRNFPKVFWLGDDVQKAPAANPDCYGTAQNPCDLLPVLDQASSLLNGQQTLISEDVVLKPDSQITYYLDETILAVTWKQIMDNYVYTISEIVVSHPSQFRRHLSGGTYGSVERYTVRQMSQQVNAVVGSSADFYMAREYGTKVYDGIVRSVNLSNACDICYIDRNGDLLFSYRGEMTDPDTIQKFVDDHGISFSISFGPILVDNGIRCEPERYALGETNKEYSRAALCQMGPLHYLVVVANSENKYFGTPTIHDFARNIEKLGCQKAYALDGGNTGNIVMNGELMNIPALGHERLVSDIIYFCTAIPDNE